MTLPNHAGIFPEPITISEAVALLKKGDVVAIPTETVYGLAAKISDESVIRKIFTTKNRPFFDPLIVHVTSIAEAKKLTQLWPQGAQLLADAFWPGPLTLVLPKSPVVHDLITSGLDTVAIRWPRHPIAQEIIRALGEPVAAPSANKFGRTSPTSAKHVLDEFEGIVGVVDGGPCEVGIESTILKISETESQISVTVLRSGTITPEQIKSVLAPSQKTIEILKPGHNIEAPGQVKHHYMPAIPVLSIDQDLWEAWGKQFHQINSALHSNFKNPCFLKLSESPEQAARELYSQLRLCSSPPSDLIIFVKKHSHQGDHWLGIIDRLQRASTYHLVQTND